MVKKKRAGIKEKTCLNMSVYKMIHATLTLRTTMACFMIVPNTYQIQNIQLQLKPAFNS